MEEEEGDLQTMGADRLGLVREIKRTDVLNTEEDRALCACQTTQDLPVGWWKVETASVLEGLKANLYGSLTNMTDLNNTACFSH